MRVSEVPTPALLLDLDLLERNLDTMAARFAGTHLKLRPHAKTHKSATLAHMQLDRGAIGICCATIAEAETLADGGITGMLLTSEVAGEPKIRRLLTLAARAQPIIVVDDPNVAVDIAAAAHARGLRIDTLVDIDIGQHRTGVAPGAAVALGTVVAAQPGLHLRGLQGYEGHLQHVTALEERRAAHAQAMALLTSTAEAFRSAALSTEIVTTGGTGTSPFASEYRAITDVQAGSYVMMDTQYRAIDGVAAFEHALTVLATVISLREDWAVVDAGYKALSIDGAAPRPLAGDARFELAGDEHGKLSFGSAPPAAGTTMQFIPGHCDTTVNLYEEFVVHRNGAVVDRWPIGGRSTHF